MSQGWRRLFVVWALSVAQVASAGRLAVLELSGEKLQPTELGLLTDTVRGAVVSSVAGDVKVMTRENMEVMLADMGLDASCVSEGACEVETARNLGVDYVVSGQVVGLGDLLVVSLKLHETEGGTLLASEQCRGGTAIDLLDALPGPSSKLVASLGAPPVVPQPVPVMVPAPAVVSAPPVAPAAPRFVLTGDEPTPVQNFFASYVAPISENGIPVDANGRYVSYKTFKALASLDPQGLDHIRRHKRTNGTFAIGVTVGILASLPLGFGLVELIPNENPSTGVPLVAAGGGLFVSGLTMAVAGDTKGDKEIKKAIPYANQVLEEYVPGSTGAAVDR